MTVQLYQDNGDGVLHQGDWLGIDLAYGPVGTPNDLGDPDELQSGVASITY